MQRINLPALQVYSSHPCRLKAFDYIAARNAEPRRTFQPVEVQSQRPLSAPRPQRLYAARCPT